MNKQASAATRAQRESAWRDRLARFASSGKTAEAFCRDEAVSTASFYGWRGRLRARDGDSEPAPSAAAPFIDLGTMAGVGSVGSRAASTANASGVEVRIDLGHGVVLSIVRH